MLNGSEFMVEIHNMLSRSYIESKRAIETPGEMT